MLLDGRYKLAQRRRDLVLCSGPAPSLGGHVDGHRYLLNWVMEFASTLWVVVSIVTRTSVTHLMKWLPVRTTRLDSFARKDGLIPHKPPHGYIRQFSIILQNRGWRLL